MGEIDKVLNNCIECGLCLNECDFLQKYCTYPKEIALNYKKKGYGDEPTIPYSCNICSLCKFRCPVGLDIGKMAIEMRQDMVKNGIGPLKQHSTIKEAQEFYVSDEFKVTIPSSDNNTVNLFFPGCSLSAYSPEIVKNTYEYLKKKLPGTGIMLGCCGGPAYLTGDEKYFKHISNEMAFEAKNLGVKQFIVACPFCYGLLKQHQPDLNPVSIYEVLNQIGVPINNTQNKTYNIHDPCTARYESEIQSSVRNIIKMTGNKVLEIDHNREESYCCGMGGMVYVVDEELGKLKTKRTLDESGETIITYCATCRETLQGQGGHVIHLLDLLFNYSPLDASKSPPKTAEESKNNMKSLKNHFSC